MKREPVQNIISSLLILLFTYTAISKIADHERFVGVLGESPLIHKGADVVAWLLPAVELVIVLLLVFDATRRIGLYTSLILLVLFTIYLVYMICFSADKPCSCGGVISRMSWKQHVLFNLFFIALTIKGISRFKKEQVIT